MRLYLATRRRRLLICTGDDTTGEPDELVVSCTGGDLTVVDETDDDDTGSPDECRFGFTARQA